MNIKPTKHGLRLSQHGVVISELRTSPGPTHSVFDVLAAVIAVLAPPGRIGVLGFAGGGMMAPLRQLGVEAVIESVDLDRAGYELFQKHCSAWAGGVNWQQADAVAWLRRQRRGFGLLMDDLSVPQDGDVHKPTISWTVLPQLLRQRLRANGVGVFNLLPAAGGSRHLDLKPILCLFGSARIIHLEEFENRILITGDDLPTARSLGAQLRSALEGLQSRQAARIQVRTIQTAR
jgi:hypothetical protein